MKPNVEANDAHSADQESMGGRVIGPSRDSHARDQLARMVLDGLRVSSGVLGGLYVIFGIGHLQYPPSIARVLVPIAWASAVVLFVLFAFLYRRESLGPMTGHVLTVGVVALVLTNCLTHLGLTRDPLQTTNLVLLLVGAGALFLSTPMLIALILLTLSGWVALAGPALRLCPGVGRGPQFDPPCYATTELPSSWASA
jgi:hypothetical protein